MWQIFVLMPSLSHCNDNRELRISPALVQRDMSTVQVRFDDLRAKSVRPESTRTTSSQLHTSTRIALNVHPLKSPLLLPGHGHLRRGKTWSIRLFHEVINSSREASILNHLASWKNPMQKVNSEPGFKGFFRTVSCLIFCLCIAHFGCIHLGTLHGSIDNSFVSKLC